MFRPNKAIIRHHINEDFYSTAHFLKSSFHLACYYLSIFYLVARPFSVYVGTLLYISCALRFLSTLYLFVLSNAFLHFFYILPFLEQSCKNLNSKQLLLASYFPVFLLILSL
jgi:hypothetical protein